MNNEQDDYDYGAYMDGQAQYEMSRIQKGDRIIYFNQQSGEEEYGTVECANYPILKVVPDDHVLPYVYWHTSECEKAKPF